MSGKLSAATERALKLVLKGWTPYAAAKKEGIALSTIYRAIRRENEKAAGLTSGVPADDRHEDDTDNWW